VSFNAARGGHQIAMISSSSIEMVSGCWNSLGGINVTQTRHNVTFHISRLSCLKLFPSFFLRAFNSFSLSQFFLSLQLPPPPPRMSLHSSLLSVIINIWISFESWHANNTALFYVHPKKSESSRSHLIRFTALQSNKINKKYISEASTCMRNTPQG
jgi:hypothetical protein